MKKFIKYFLLLALLGLIISGCDKLGTPDIRDEYYQDKKPDFFGWRFDFKW